jgi:uncharacterized RDD family membrane protein YckC
MTDTQPPEYAGPVTRAVAYGLDAVIVAFAFTSAAVVIGIIASMIGAQARELVHAGASAYLLVLPMLLAVYCAVFWALAERTPGMALLGVRVAATSGHRPSWLSSLVRAVVLAYFPLGAGWAVVDRRHQAVHDKLARTVVVQFAGSSAQGRPSEAKLARPGVRAHRRWHDPSLEDEVPSGGSADR